MYTRKYSNLRGVDFSSSRSECDPSRFNYLINMWRDYKSEQGAAVETAIGFRELGNLGAQINGIHYLPANGTHGGKFIIHSGNMLYSYDPSLDWVIDVNPKKVYIDSHHIGSVGNARSSAVAYYNALYYVDGSAYLKIVNGDTVTAYDAKSTGYIPTTYRNGTAYEQRNLLYDKVREEYDADGETKEFFLHDPVYNPDITINGTQKKPLVYASPSAWSDEGYYRVFETKDHEEFEPDTYGVGTKLTFTSNKIYVGYSVIKSTTDGSYREETPILYEEKVDHSGNISRTLVGYADGWYLRYHDVYDGMPVIESIRVDKIEAGATLAIESETVPNKFSTVGDMRDILTGNPDMVGRDSALDAINGCTLITEFDDRIFLSGNPELPNTVFYSQRDSTGLNNPFYIGAYNYLNDGTDRTPITSMMTAPTQLIVLKGDAPQGSAVYYHTAAYNPSDDKVLADLQPRVYPRENGVPNVGCLGFSCNFFDDPVFVSRNGVEAIGKAQVNLERTIAHRSSNIDGIFRSEELCGVDGVEWEGYLCLLTPSGRMYLADSRQAFTHKSGDMQYEWYMWDGIGVWEGQVKQYYYVSKYLGAPYEVDGYPVGWRTEDAYIPTKEDPEKEVIKAQNAKHEHEPENHTPTYKYVLGTDANGTEVAYLVDWYGEMTGGTFKPATTLFVSDGKLYFGCENGSVCVFNDKRYSDSDGDYYAPECYAQNGRRYISGCAFLSDNCGIPNYTKSTIRGSFVAVTKAFPYAKVAVRVRTNNVGWYEADTIVAGKPDFTHFDFSSFSFNVDRECISVVEEREKKWTEKQVYFVAECYESPFGLISASFDYKVQGRVREQ